VKLRGKTVKLGAANSILDSQLGKALAAMAAKGWQGTATELADELGRPRDEKDRAKKLAGEIRKLAPDFEKLGIVVTERTLNGRVQWTLRLAEGMQAA
jgi:hypothetical protein